jgi:hypothetical protein
MTSYSSDTPHVLGQFPALAFALYHNHIAESQPVTARKLTDAQIFSGTDALRQDFTKGGPDAKTLVDARDRPAGRDSVARSAG